MQVMHSLIKTPHCYLEGNIEIENLRRVSNLVSFTWDLKGQEETGIFRVDNQQKDWPWGCWCPSCCTWPLTFKTRRRRAVTSIVCSVDNEALLWLWFLYLVSTISQGMWYFWTQLVTHLWTRKFLFVFRILWWGLVRWLSRERGLLCKPGDLSSIPATLIKVEGKNQLYRIVLWPSHVCHGTHMPPHTHHTCPHMIF